MRRYTRQETLPSNAYETNTMPSLTRPDMAPSLGTMLKRFQRGQPIDEIGQRRPIYNGDTILPDLKKMDLTEIADFQRDIHNTIKENKEKQHGIVKETQKRKSQQAAAREKSQQSKNLGDSPV